MSYTRRKRSLCVVKNFAKSLEAVQGHSKLHRRVGHVRSSRLSIVEMCLSCTISDIFSVEYWYDLEIWARVLQGHSRSLRTDGHCDHNTCSVSVLRGATN